VGGPGWLASANDVFEHLRDFHCILAVGGKEDPYIGHNLLPPLNWPYKTWLHIVTGDNSGPPGADGVKPFSPRQHRNFRASTCEWARWRSLLTRFSPRTAPASGKRRDSGHVDTWMHCDPGGMRLARNCRPLSPRSRCSTHNYAIGAFRYQIRPTN